MKEPDIVIDTDDNMTDATAADAGGPVELLRLMPPTAWEGMLVIGKIATDPKAYRRALRALHDSLAAVTAGQDKLAADRAEQDAQLAKDRAEISAERVKLREGQVALANQKDSRENNLAEREQRIRELEHRWAFVGEDDDVRRGFRSAEFGALYKARSAMGFTSDTIAGLDGIAEQMREKYPPSRTVKHDPQGTPFRDGLTLTRDEPEPPAGVRVRGRKGAQASP